MRPVLGNSKVMAFLLAAFIPMALLTAWVCLNQEYPISDASITTAYGYRNYLTWDKGFWTWLTDLYTHRYSVKPVFYTVIQTVFFGLTAGDVLWAARLLCILSYALFLASCFSALALFLPLSERTLATLFIGLLPWAICNQHFMNIEIPSAAANIAALAFLWRARNFDSVRSGQLLGVFLALSFGIRPADTLTFFLIPLSFWLVTGVRERSITTKEALLWPATLIPFLIVLLLSRGGFDAGLTEGWHLFARLVILCGPGIALFALRKPLRLNTTLSWALLIPILFASFWYGPVMDQLRAWFFIGGYGAPGEVLDTAGMDLLYKVCRWLFGPAIVLPIIAAALAFPWKNISAAARRLFFVGLLTSALPIAIAMTSKNHVVRYYFAPALLIYGVTLHYALSRSPIWRRTRLVLISITCILLLGWNLQATFFPPVSVDMVPSGSIDLYYRLRPLTKEDPIKVFMNTLGTVLPATFMRVGIVPAGYPLMGDHTKFSMGLMRIPLMAMELGYDWNFDLDYSDFIDYHFYQTHDAVIFGPMPMVGSIMIESAKKKFSDLMLVLGWKIASDLSIDFYPYPGEYVIFVKNPDAHPDQKRVIRVAREED